MYIYIYIYINVCITLDNIILHGKVWDVSRCFLLIIKQMNLQSFYFILNSLSYLKKKKI
jgi:hypothetical protein